MIKIKILHITFNMGIGGATRTVQSFIKYKNKNIFDEAVMCLGEDGPRRKSIEELGAKVFIVNNSSDAGMKVIAEFKPDIIHLHFDGQGSEILYQILDFARTNKIKIVGTNIFAYYDRKIDQLLDVHLFKSKMMLTVKFKRISKLLELPYKKYKVLYNPVDTETFKQLEINKEKINKLKSKLGIPLDVPVIGRVGRADVVKWGDLLLETFPLVFKKIPNCYLIIRGIPKSRLLLIQKKSWAKNVIILPETTVDSEVMTTYQLLDLYTHTTKIGEAFGNTLNEAMFYKKPIVTHSTPHTDNGQLEQVISGYNGIIANTPESFSEAIITLLNDKNLRKKMGEAGHKKVLLEYNPQQTTHRLERIYLQLLPKRILNKQMTQWSNAIKPYPEEKDLNEYPKIYNKIAYLTNNLSVSLKELIRVPGRITQRLKDAYKFKYEK